MSTIKITTRTLLEDVKEISLPCYVKDTAHFYKVFSDKQCLCVTEMHEGGNHSIKIEDAYLAFSSAQHEESNEQEFKAAFKRISEILDTL